MLEMLNVYVFNRLSTYIWNILFFIYLVSSSTIFNNDVPLEGEDEETLKKKNKNNMDSKLVSYEFGRYTQTQTFLFPKNPKSDQC